jgi:isopentenyl diphosphate isomerase/L-lactate dehydrogenase-like FMN-dependent dehydrogenase
LGTRTRIFNPFITIKTLRILRPAAAQNLVKKGIRSIEELKANQSELNHHQKIGLM